MSQKSLRVAAGVGAVGLVALAGLGLATTQTLDAPVGATLDAVAPAVVQDASVIAEVQQEEVRSEEKLSKIAGNSGILSVIGTSAGDGDASEIADLFGAEGESGLVDPTSVQAGSGGLIGSTGVQVGSGGLGSRGSGLGGGGTALGLGGLGTKGIGAGSVGGSGYGRGSGAFGARGAPPRIQSQDIVVRGPAPRANSEHYTDYGVHAMVLAESDRLSTFAVDVDTASYAIARRKLESGVLPPQASVRVEEFVNYFDYAYEAPEPNADAPFAVHMEAAPSPFVANHHVLRIGIQGAEPQTERAPAHLTFLVDTSCSMSSEDKLGLVKRSLHEMVDHLDDEDTVALATYAGSTQAVLQPTPTTRRSEIHRAIDGLGTGGGTAMASGMDLAYEMAQQSYLSGAENRVVVLSDGDANIGRTSPDAILSTIRTYAERGITLTTVGFGQGNYQDTMMERLANEGDGNYYYIDSFAEAQKVFGTEITSTVQTIARDVKIQVEFNPEEVYGYRLIGYENRDIADRDFRNDAVDAGEIGAGHQVTALYDVVLRDGKAEGPLATVRLRAKEPGPDRPAQEWVTSCTPRYLRAELPDASRSFRLAFAVATFGDKLRGSRYAQEVTYAQIYNLAQGAAREVRYDQQLLGLITQAASLSGERLEIASR